MRIVANLLVALVALAHVYFPVLEMFLWTRPLGRAVKRLGAEHAPGPPA